ncbi:MAG: uridine kinase [Proteobacteria bacterium]|jgi:uridine kinase|nr:uridine kinase [Pseudomonadota bacterium]
MLIGIAGGTGSGKTTVAHTILERLPRGEAALIEHDWYYRDYPELSFEQKSRQNFDEPEALENDLLVAHLKELKAGRAIECPQYDFATHSRKAETRRVAPCRIVVVEGILTFALPALRALFDLRLFVDTDDDIRLMRRIKRDLVKRGRDIGSIQDQYYGTVRPMHRLHVAPSKDHAHLIIPEGGENRAALDVIVGCLLYGLK